MEYSTESPVIDAWWHGPRTLTAASKKGQLPFALGIVRVEPGHVFSHLVQQRSRLGAHTMY